MTMKNVIIFTIVFMLAASPLWPMDVCPEGMQAVLVLKIIPFVRNFEKLTPQGTVNIGVYNAPEVYRFLDTASKKVVFKTNLIQLSEGDPKLDNLHIIYIPRGCGAAVVEKLNRLAKKGGVLTVFGDPQGTLDFGLTLSFYVTADKPKILINMKSAKEEGIVFSSRVLTLADVRNMEKGSTQ